MKLLDKMYCVFLLTLLLFHLSCQITAGCNTYDLRITAPQVGIVEICISGSWKRICSVKFSPANAKVACRELGYSPNNALNLIFPRNVGPDNRASFSCEGSESKLGLCTPILQQDLCSEQGDAGVNCSDICTQGDVRLAGGYSAFEGRVEVCLSGRWGTVCDDLWDDNDAKVVCQQMGSYSVSRGAAALNSTFSWGSGPIHLSNVQCTGMEENLLSCPLQLDNNCFHSEDAGVTCLGLTLSRRCTYKDLRLIRTGEAPVGLVEVCTVSGNWVRICSIGWTEREAQVACRQLGYSAQGPDCFVSVSNFFFTGINISGDGCTGDEINLSYCDVSFTSTCRSTMSAGLQCKAICLNGEIRLMGGHSNLEGRVEVCVDGRWETISDDGWGVNEATVVCRQLRYNTTGVVAFGNAAFGEGSGPIVIRRIICMGHETRLSSCNSSSSPTIFSHSEDAGVRCSCYENSLRLVNGSTSLEGRVEVCVNGTYGTICDDNFGINDASVLCRQLGYGAALQTYSNAHFGPGFGYIFIDGLRCTGNEMSFINCNYDRHTSDCSHREDASIMCEGSTCEEYDVRLVNGSFLEGRVELCLQQEWGSVCDNMWDDLDAQVVCRQLGYSTIGAVAIRNSFYGHGNGPLLLDSVACNGSETSLHSCLAHQSPQLCSQDSQAGVQCQAFCADWKVRLTGGNTTYGRVEVCLQGSYRTVCADNWDNNDATVVCRQLHQSTTGAFGFRFGPGSSELMISCTGNELSLLACSRPLSECISSEEAGAQCMEGCTSDILRRVNIIPTAPDQFLVEMCVNGVWTTVCHSGWTLTEVRVVCRELGYSTISVEYYDPPAGLNPPGPYVGDFMCSGNEFKLAACSHGLLSTCDRQGGVQCSELPCIEGQTRLINGTSATNTTSGFYDGRVEICLSGTWGTICDDLWDDHDAQVVCSSLGFSRLGAIAYSGGLYPAGTGSIKLSNTICTGSETSLLNCSTRVDHTCTHAEDAGVRCMAICPAAINMLNCENSGFCALSTQDQSSYFCQCLPGFTGQRCEIDIDTYCVNRECRNGGMCMEGYGENVSCICLPAFTGEFCESQIDWCYHNTCQNGGSCIEQPISGILCDCTYSFTGRFCEMKQCATELCLNGGSCLPADGSCICPVGFTGERCESSEFCASEPCMNGGTCLPADGSCICPVGFTGERCESSDFCASEPCMNGGTCLPADGSCICPVGFTGERCESSDFCASEPCMNGGTCLPADGSCICPVGFTGERCESNDFCASEPCMNGGTCEEESCICPLGYEGSNCGMDVDNCFNTICENGGTCIEGEGISTACMCALEYGGPICSVQVFDKNAPCPDETDELWNLQYPETQPGRSVSHPCNSVLPTGGSMTVSGITSRACGVGGIWGPVVVSSCRRTDIMQLERMVNEVFGQDNIQGEAVDILIEGLANATTPQGISQFPTDLEATTSIIDRTVLYLQDDLKSLTLSQLRTGIVKVMSNALDAENIVGWNGIAEGNVGSESLLRSAEMYGNYFATALTSDNVNKSAAIMETKGITENNIELQVAEVNKNKIEDVVFPDEVKRINKNGSAQSIVPSTFLVDKGAENHEVNVINILFKNLESILPRHSISASLQPATSVISTQVISAGNVSGNVGSQDAIVKFHFTTKVYGSDKNVTNATCAFYKFERNLARSTWSTENVITTDVIPNGNNTFNVTCESQHLTSFSVLVNVNNVELSDIDNKVLTYITYIGLSISMFCLILTILFFIVIVRKQLFERVHYFIHLNLSIALLLGYVTFLAGIETAVGNRIGCAFVAGLLHYLFTAAFCWMLCEGIMMYLMLVVVFSGLSKKWWFFFLLGWGTPLIIVGVSAAIVHREYGTEDYCWISSEDLEMGAIWAFTLPMLFVIIINTGFLIGALITLYRIRRDQQVKSPMEKKVGIIATTKLFWRLFLGSIILLPLLGLTWAFGLLSVSRSTTVFAYVFTILNSLQGFFIFFFHVIRSEKVWGKLCSKKAKQSKATRSTNDAIHTKGVGPSRKSQDRSNIVSSYTSESIEMDAADTNKLVEPARDEEDEDF